MRSSPQRKSLLVICVGSIACRAGKRIVPRAVRLCLDTAEGDAVDLVVTGDAATIAALGLGGSRHGAAGSANIAEALGQQAFDRIEGYVGRKVHETRPKTVLIVSSGGGATGPGLLAVVTEIVQAALVREGLGSSVHVLTCLPALSGQKAVDDARSANAAHLLESAQKAGTPVWAVPTKDPDTVEADLQAALRFLLRHDAPFHRHVDEYLLAAQSHRGPTVNLISVGRAATYAFGELEREINDLGRALVTAVQGAPEVGVEAELRGLLRTALRQATEEVLQLGGLRLADRMVKAVTAAFANATTANRIQHRAAELVVEELDTRANRLPAASRAPYLDAAVAALARPVAQAPQVGPRPAPPRPTNRLRGALQALVGALSRPVGERGKPAPPPVADEPARALAALLEHHVESTALAASPEATATAHRHRERHREAAGKALLKRRQVGKLSADVVDPVAREPLHLPAGFAHADPHERKEAAEDLLAQARGSLLPAPSSKSVKLLQRSVNALEHLCDPPPPPGSRYVYVEGAAAAAVRAELGAAPHTLETIATDNRAEVWVYDVVFCVAVSGVPAFLRAKSTRTTAPAPTPGRPPAQVPVAQAAPLNGRAVQTQLSPHQPGAELRTPTEVP